MTMQRDPGTRPNNMSLQQSPRDMPLQHFPSCASFMDAELCRSTDIVKLSFRPQEETLMGDIGGQLGLFIGISCITLIEFFDLLWRLIPQRKKTAPNQVRAFQVAER